MVLPPTAEDQTMAEYVQLGAVKTWYDECQHESTPSRRPSRNLRHARAGGLD